MTEPRGMLAILTDGAGHVVATATDFEGGGHQDAQRLRAESLLAIALVRALCHPDILRALRPHQSREIMAELCRNAGYRVTWRAIGYGEGEG